MWWSMRVWMICVCIVRRRVLEGRVGELLGGVKGRIGDVMAVFAVGEGKGCSEDRVIER